MIVLQQEITIGGSRRPVDIEYNCVGEGVATVVLAVPVLVNMMIFY